MSDGKKFLIGYTIYVAVVVTLLVLFSSCAGEPPRSQSGMTECRALCRGDVQSYIDDATQCLCRDREPLNLGKK